MEEFKAREVVVGRDIVSEGCMMRLRFLQFGAVAFDDICIDAFQHLAKRKVDGTEPAGWAIDVDRIEVPFFVSGNEPEHSLHAGDARGMANECQVRGTCVEWLWVE